MNEQDNDTGEMLHPPSSGEGLRWRAWPCPECSGGFSPIGVLIRRAEASAAILRGSPEQIAERQVALLQEWVGSCEHTTESLLSLPEIAEGSEHVVYLREADACVFKVTKPGTFGESYFLKNNLVHQRNCSPLDYLIRLRLWRKVFGSTPIDLGVTECGRILSVQKFIEGELPTQDAVDDFWCRPASLM